VVAAQGGWPCKRSWAWAYERLIRRPLTGRPHRRGDRRTQSCQLRCS
jgi:hypothetical protein